MKAEKQKNKLSKKMYKEQLDSLMSQSKKYASIVESPSKQKQELAELNLSPAQI